MPTLLDKGDLIFVKMGHFIGLVLTPIVFWRERSLALTGVVIICEDGFAPEWIALIIGISTKRT
jgi:hypothetical protein